MPLSGTLYPDFVVLFGRDAHVLEILMYVERMIRRSQVLESSKGTVSSVECGSYRLADRDADKIIATGL
jgi:hypothetical protein